MSDGEDEGRGEREPTVESLWEDWKATPVYVAGAEGPATK